MKTLFKILAVAALLYAGMGKSVWADIYINVVAVNGADKPKTSTIHFDLPGELTAEDILDTNGLQVDYNVDDANYFVYGDVTLKPKESKTFRIHIKDKWMVSSDDEVSLKKQIEQGYETIGKPYNAKNAEILKAKLDDKVDYVVGLQSASADSIEKRIANYRIYTSTMKRIEDEALSVDYWRSDPSVKETPGIVHLNIEVSNPTKSIKHFKHKDYLPAEVKTEDVVEPEDFEVRFDSVKQLAFLFKEEDLAPGEKKKYSIGILDIWNIKQSNIDYLRKRADNAYGVLKDTKYQKSAKILFDRIGVNLKAIEDSQAVQRPIVEHISAYRANKDTYEAAKADVENLEKLLALFREDLEKSKVENILQKMQSLKGLSDISNVMFNKKFENSTAWGFMGWVLAFVGLVTLAGFIVSLIRSKDKKIKEDATAEK